MIVRKLAVILAIMVLGILSGWYILNKTKTDTVKLDVVKDIVTEIPKIR